MDESPETVPTGPGPRIKKALAKRTGAKKTWPQRIRRSLCFLPVLLILWWALIGLMQMRLSPKGTHVVGAWHKVPANSISFASDLTWTAPDGATARKQHVFDALFDLIDQAETFLVLDFFLINDFAGDPESAPRALSGELIDALARAKTRRPELEVLLITDPINRVYGSESHPGFERLEALGVDVVETNLDRLRDSNPIYSSIYRLLFSWFGNKQGGGFLPNPFLSNDETTLRSWLRLLNFKANHRKVAIAGRRSGPTLGFVTSANPHDASSGHSNVALLFEGGAALDLLDSEITVARFSGWKNDSPLRALAEEARRQAHSRDQALPLEPFVELPAEPPEGRHSATAQSVLTKESRGESTALDSDPSSAPMGLRILTEGAIRDAVLASLALAKDGDSVDLAMFYFGHREIVEALLKAAERGARVRLILDPNRDAFGRTKNGIPNRSVANELIQKSIRAARTAPAKPIAVRWYKTQGEQFHTKLTLVSLQNDCCNKPASRLLLGSANFTRRNLDDFNLETNIEVHMAPGAALQAEVRAYLDRLWNNGGSEERGGEASLAESEFTLDYETYADPSRWSNAKYRWMEKTGLSTF